MQKIAMQKIAFRPAVENLEGRQLMAGIAFNAFTGHIVISGAPQCNTAIVSQVGNQISVNLRSAGNLPQSQSFPAASVTGIEFYGGPANDAFNNGTAKPAVAYGGAGSDVLVGGSANDQLSGESGNDLLDGGAGHDWLFGGLGDDIVLGSFGNDWLYGGAGHDILHGGDGSDTLQGEAGNDLLCGGSGLDSLTDLQGANSFYDSNMALGRYFGSYRGNSHDRYSEGQFLADNLTASDLQLRRALQSSSTTGNSAAIDQILQQGNIYANANFGVTPQDMLRDSLNDVFGGV
jgi:Ca2+-binding RTX toxin-like protein